MSTLFRTTIASGAALSSEIDMSGHRVSAIIMPASWTAANLTFQAAEKVSGTYQDVYDDANTEVNVPAAGARVITIDKFAAHLSALKAIKIRSGTTATPVNQGADRIILIIAE